MAGANRFRSVSLTQQFPITSARSKPDSPSATNTLDELTTALAALLHHRSELETELLQASTPSLFTSDASAKLSEVNASILLLEARLRHLQHHPTPSKLETPTSAMSRSESFSPSQRFRSSTLSTFGSGEVHQISIDSIRFANIPPSQSHLSMLQLPELHSQAQLYPISSNSSHTGFNADSMPLSRGLSHAALPAVSPSFAPVNGLVSSPTSRTSSQGDLLYMSLGAGKSTDTILNYYSHNTNGNSHNGNTDSSPTWLLSDILQSISANKDQDEYFLVSRGNDLVLLLSQYPQLKKDLVVKTFIGKIMFMLSHPILEVRATGYRIARYIISDYESLTVLVQSMILIFIIITLARSNCQTEKEQALKLVRDFLNIPHGANNLSIGVVKSILAIIESDIEDLNTNVEDELKVTTFRNICIETILEISVIKTELVFLSGGISTIIQILQDGPLDLAISGLFCILQILDSVETRKFLRDGRDLASLVSIFSDVEAETQTKNFDEKHEPQWHNQKHMQHQAAPDKSAVPEFSPLKMQRQAFLICIFLKNWNGLMAFSHNEFESWNILVSTMKKSNNKVNEIIADMFLDILMVKSLPWLKQGFMTDIVSKLQNNFAFVNGTSASYKTLDENSLEYSLINHYLGIIVDILVNKCNIMEVLLAIIDDASISNTNLFTKTNELIANIYVLSYKLLPKELIETKKLVFGDSITFQSIIDKVNPHETNQISSISNLALIENVKKYVSNLSIESRYNMEDGDLKDKIARTKVPTVKEFEEWNWVQLSEIMQGPMRNPKKFEEILKNNPKFLKRLMSFYRPFKFRFCNIVTTASGGTNQSKMVREKHRLYYKVGCQFFDALLSTNEGMKYLSNNKIIPQLSETFAQVDPFSGIKAKEAILSRRRLKRTLSCGYIDFIGVLSKYEFGIKLLSQWQFFNIFHHIIEGSIISMNDKSSDVNYLIILLLEKLDYVIDSPLRIILAKALTICTSEIQVFIMESLLINKLLKIRECEKWVIGLVVQKLYDTNELVTDLAIETLTDYCNISEANLKHIISLKPSVNLLLKRGRQSGKGEALTVKFLSTTEGFKYLESIGYIEKEFNLWVSQKNHDFARSITLKLEQRMFPYNIRATKANDASATSPNSDSTLLHFFSHLLQTEEGLLYLQQNKNRQFLDNLVSETEAIRKDISNRFSGQGAIREDDEMETSNIQMNLEKLKGNLWIIGCISSSPYGIQLLDSEYSRTLPVPIIPLIIDLVSNFPFWHVRGVAFYQLGRIASTIEGTEILDELNWILVFDRFNRPCSLAYPEGENRLRKVFHTEVSNPYRDIKYYTVFGGNGPTSDFDLDIDDYDNDLLIQDTNNSTTDTYLTEEEVLKYHNRVLTLINHLSAVLGKIERKASKELLNLKHTVPDLFHSTNLFFKVIKLVDRGKYKLRVRRFIFSLFLDTKILEALVKKARKK